MIDKEDLLVVVDENITRLDAVLQRIIFCFAEIPLDVHSGSVLQQIKDFGHKWCAENPNHKFHLTDFTNADDIDKIVDLIIKLRPTVKAFVFYTIDSNTAICKGQFLKQAIKTVNSNNYRRINIKWAIENANEYDGIIKLESLSNDKKLTVVSDAFCYLLAKKLTGDDSYMQQYERIRPLIRLKYIQTHDGTLALAGHNVI